MGKAGIVAQKTAATLASTGTRSHFIHPAEAFHGDLGRIHCDDVVLAFSQSGETEEVIRLLPSLAQFDVRLIAVVSKPSCTLGEAADVVVELGPLGEADPLGLAPSTSTTAMLAIGDALALVASRMRNFGPQDFARFHPGGALGLKLSKVEDHMRPLADCRVASEEKTIREVFVACTRPGRRTGAIMLVDAAGKLSGLFTDSDLARQLESTDVSVLDRPIQDVMTRRPLTAVEGSRLSEAGDLLAQRKISELPVVDQQGRPVGLLDLTDLWGLFPHDDAKIAKPKTSKADGQSDAPKLLSYPDSQPLRRSS
jgi:arabinose-5-phosphate isomerase